MQLTSYEQAIFDQFYQQNSLPNGSLRSVGSLLEKAAQEYPERIAIYFEHSSITFGQLFARACAVSKRALELGIQPGDRVIIFVPNSIEFYVAYYGVLYIGAVVAPLNTFLTEKELAHILHDAQPKLIFTSAELMTVLQKVEGKELPPIITLDDPVFKETSQLTSVEPRFLEPNAMAALLYTSGTTGLPKGVMLSSNNIMYNVLQSIARFNPTKQERIFAVLPLFHSFAQNTCVWTPFVVGASVIVVPKIDRRAILQGLQHRPTIFLGVPALYGLMCLLKTAPLDSVKLFVSGGDAMPDKIRAGFSLIYRRKICSGYGLTETSPVISADFDDEAMPTNTVGRPLLGIECKLLNEQGQPVTDGTIGELWVKGPNVMLGYYNEPQKTAETLQDGWLATGDFAYFDEKGRIVISGRLKDLISHKGIKIYPQEVENIIMMHPNVLRTGVIGKIDERVGEIPVAYVQIKEAQDNIEKALKDLCTKHLAAYKVPRIFICSTDALPLTATGKVDKKILRSS